MTTTTACGSYTTTTSSIDPRLSLSLWLFPFVVFLSFSLGQESRRIKRRMAVQAAACAFFSRLSLPN